jgi:hypothetical protein
MEETGKHDSGAFGDMGERKHAANSLTRDTHTGLAARFLMSDKTFVSCSKGDLARAGIRPLELKLASPPAGVVAESWNWPRGRWSVRGPVRAGASDYTFEPAQ